MSIDWTGIYKQYQGMWVALADDEVTVLAADPDALTALRNGRQAGKGEPTLHRVPEKVISFAGHEV